MYHFRYPALMCRPKFSPSVMVRSTAFAFSMRYGDGLLFAFTARRLAGPRRHHPRRRGHDPRAAAVLEVIFAAQRLIFELD